MALIFIMSVSLCSSKHAHNYYRVFHRRLTRGGGGFLTIGYCSPIVFWDFLWVDKALMQGGQSRDGGILPVSLTKKNPALFKFYFCALV